MIYQSGLKEILGVVVQRKVGRFRKLLIGKFLKAGSAMALPFAMILLARQ